MAVIAKQRYKLDIAPKGGWVIVYASQHDNGAREIEFEITNQGNAYSIPASINISVQGVKSNKGYFSHSCSYSGNIVKMALANDMTDVIGKAICVLKFTNSSQQKLATAKFILNVDSDSSSEGIIIDTEAEEIFNQMLNDIRAQASAISADIAGLQSMVGTPLVASTASAMTDHNKIYVYTGSESGYTSGNWYYWSGSAWVSGGVYNSTAFETDKTLSVENMAADAKVVGDKINVLGEYNYQYINQNSLTSDTTWSYSSANGFYRSESSGGVTADPFNIKAGTYYVIGFNGFGSFFLGKDGTRKTFYQLFNIGQSSNVQELTFSQDGTVYFTGITSSSSTIRHLFADNTLPDSDITGAYNIKYNGVDINALEDVKDIVFPVVNVEWKKGGLNAAGTLSPSSANRVYSNIINVPCTIEFVGDVRSTVFFYKGTEYIGKLNPTNGIDMVSGQWGTIGGTVDLMQFIANYPTYEIDGLRFVLRNINNPADDAEAQTIGDASCTVAAFGGVLKDYLKNTFVEKGITGHKGDAVVFGFLHQSLDVVNISVPEYIRGGQSFCIYNDKYYSTDGGNVYVQSRNFTLESTTPLDVGHGNAFQVGHSNLGYISGWDDSTIYVINMDAVSIVDTITLPITGYFSAVVDDLNNLAYILYRTDRPSTIDNYNFAVYDITSNQIISSKKIFAFGALQDCDYLDGKIVFMYGIPASNLPSGMCIINTSGDVIVNIYDEKISDAEPEGCAFDKVYNRLLFCRGAYYIFSVTGLSI